ncbi:sugar nucleotide-binding protein [Alphaproteobacteria bacterium]|nr:sugar nucleotide-binding protein [Alphaproteobacteria bacterium]
MKVLILGAYGRLGVHLSKHLFRSNFDVIRQGRSPLSELQIDPTIYDSLWRALDALKPDAIINLTALTDILDCEKYKRLARKVNEHVPKHIAMAAGSNSLHKETRVIHLSTDHVYSSGSYNDETNAVPVNQYALTKLNGETHIKKIQGTVLRTNFIGKSGNGRHLSFTDWAVKELKNGNQIFAFDDIYLSALHYSSLCENIEAVLQDPVPGVFNLGCIGRYTKADVVCKVAEIVGASQELVKKCAANFPDGIIRPADMSMNAMKFTRHYGDRLPEFSEELEKLKHDYK